MRLGCPVNLIDFQLTSICVICRLILSLSGSLFNLASVLVWLVDADSWKARLWVF